MSKIKRLANSRHSPRCQVEIASDGLINYLCEEDCEIARNGGVVAVSIAMDAVDRKKQKRKRYQSRKKRRGY